MYEKGLIKITTPPCEEYIAEEWCDDSLDEDSHGKHTISDNRANYPDGLKTEAGIAYLPHSCSEWVIGGPEQIKAMIADLQALLE